MEDTIAGSHSVQIRHVNHLHDFKTKPRLLVVCETLVNDRRSFHYSLDEPLPVDQISKIHIVNKTLQEML